MQSNFNKQANQGQSGYQGQSQQTGYQGQGFQGQQQSGLQGQQQSGQQSGLQGQQSGLQGQQSGFQGGQQSGLQGQQSGFQGGQQSGFQGGQQSGLQGQQSGLQGQQQSGSQGQQYQGQQSSYLGQQYQQSAANVQNVRLPTQVIEKPLAIHEEIRREQVEEIQPIVNIEKLKTEIHQVTQPLFDKEIKPVNMQQRTLPSQLLPEVNLPGRGAPSAADVSTVHEDSSARVIEKSPIYTEIDRLQVIEEIQPVLYKETIVPTFIQETKPVYQKIVEGPVYSQETRPARDIHGTRYAAPQLNTTTVPVMMKEPDTLIETTKIVTTTTTTATPNLPTFAR